MKVPRRINDIIRQKQEYLDARDGQLSSIILRYQDRMLSEILRRVIPELDVENGVIKDSLKNMRLLKSLDRVYEDFGRVNYPVILNHFNRTTDQIGKLSDKYYRVTLGEVPDFYPETVERATMMLRERIGADVSGGFLPKLIKNESLQQTIRNAFSGAIVTRAPLRELIKDVNEIITGAGVKEGGLESQVKRYAHDLYMQYDASYNDILARKLKLNYFIYSGTLIKDSRDFCAAHQWKVWSRQEAAGWPRWTPSKGEYPETWIIKQKDIYKVPSYIAYAGYHPVIDRGGFNCRHSLAWITDGLAVKMRPELKKE